MRRQFTLGLGLALAIGANSVAFAQTQPTSRARLGAPTVVADPAETSAAPQTLAGIVSDEKLNAPKSTPKDAAPAKGATLGAPEGTVVSEACGNGCCERDCGDGPVPLMKVGILQHCLFGDCPAPCNLKIAGWADFDYTYRSTGHGINNIAPVMNRFGDEFLVRQLGLYLSKPLDPNCLSFGFNMIFIAGADASFLGPIGGGWANPNPRFGSQFTDLNLTMHLPILTEGGVDVKAGRQTTVLGPMGALPWQRYFTSSDYAWYNLEEGRYTGVSATWHVNKQLDIYNGIEFGWGEFFDYYSPAPQYIGQISYWLDCEAKKTKVWTTVLTGQTGQESTGASTVVEVGVQHNWNKCVYQIVDFQMVYSRAPIFGVAPPGYTERAYDVYTVLGTHLNKCLDLNSRFEWYYDHDGLGYPGGFGAANTNYYAATLGVDYHPTKWLQFRPEIRYDYATNPRFGVNLDHQGQLTLAAEVLLKF